MVFTIKYSGATPCPNTPGGRCEFRGDACYDLYSRRQHDLEMRYEYTQFPSAMFDLWICSVGAALFIFLILSLVRSGKLGKASIHVFLHSYV